MSLPTRWGLAILLAACFPTSAGAQGVPAPPPKSANLTGLVVVDSIATPIPGAVVELVGTVLRAVTDSTGAFEIVEIPVGIYLVRVRAAGFLQELFEIEIEDDLDLEGVIALKRIPPPADADALRRTDAPVSEPAGRRARASPPEG